MRGLPLLPTSGPDALKRGRGRPKSADRPDEREKHLRVAYYRYVQGASVRSLALMFDATERTIFRWLNAVLTYDEPEAVNYRRLAAAKAR